MKSLRYSLILLAIASGAALSGCSVLPKKDLYVPVGNVVEVAEEAHVTVYYTNKETGKREKRAVRVKPDGIWHVGRLAPPDNKPLPPQPKKKSIGARIKDWFKTT